MKRIKMLLVLLVGISIIAVGCQQKSNEISSKESESQSQADIKQELSIRVERKEEENVKGIWHWQLRPMEFDEQKSLTIGAVIPTDSFFGVEMWEPYVQELNQYMAKESGYSIGFELYAYDKDARKEAVQRCLQEEIDIFYGQLIQLEELKVAQNFISLSERKEVREIYSFWPEKFWTYINSQLGGDYGFVHLLDLYGYMEINVDVKCMKQNQMKWPILESVEPTLDFWQEVVLKLAEQLPEGNTKVIKLFPSMQYEGAFLPVIAPESVCQILAPGVGFNFETGQIEAILDMPQIKQRIEIMQGWIEQGLAGEGEALLTGFDWHESGQGIRETKWEMEDSSFEKWFYPIGSQSYYPLDFQNCTTSFTGIMKTSPEEKQETALHFLQKAEQDEELKRILLQDGNFLIHLLPDFSYYILENEENPTTYYNSNGEETTLYALMYQAYTEAEISPYTGIHFDVAAVEKEIEAVKKIITRNQMVTLENGGLETWAEEIESFKKELEEAGIEAIVSEMQKQLQEWQQKQ